MRILGKGKTAQAVREVFKEAIMYDDADADTYDKYSDELTVVSPGMPPFNKLVKNTKNLISDYDLFLSAKYNKENTTLPLSVWISGTNGKTTTTQMIQHLLEDKQSENGGNIGTPLASLDKSSKIWILETSSYTLHYTNHAKPNIYILLPISEDHLSWHGSFPKYEKAKLKPLDFLNVGEIAIVPSKYKDYKTRGKLITYKNSECLEKEFGIDKSKVNFKEPFLMDALLSLALEKILFNTISYDKINTFKTDVHKLEELNDRQNRTWVNDSKATNVDASIQALKTYKDKKMFLIIGGDDKNANLEPLFEEIVKHNVELFLIGLNTAKFSSLSKKYKLNNTVSGDLVNAVKAISLEYKDNVKEIAILSPAAASFDQFKSFENRGELFKKYVNNI